MTASLGIAITTYNRRDTLLSTLAELRRLTSVPFELVVCDDGSSDGTIEAVRGLGVDVVGGNNRGIAWNKNRGLFYLSQSRRCETILLLDDDVRPVMHGWEQEWIAACARFGHVNYIPPHYRRDLLAGNMTASKPGIGPVVGGMAIGQSAAALSCVGYMDVRFGRYGHEHSDFTGRFLRAGFGGFVYRTAGVAQTLYYLIDGGIELLAGPGSGTNEDLERNARLLGQLAADPLYRAPWRDDAEMRHFMADMPSCFQGAERGILPAFESFSAETYLARYQDVRDANIDPLEHFVRIGHSEGRQPLAVPA